MVQTEITVETIEHLYSMREYLSHVDKGQVSTRIEFAKNQDTFVNVQKDVKKILECLNPILDIYVLILDKSLLENGLDPLKERIKIWPDEAKHHTGSYL